MTRLVDSRKSVIDVSLMTKHLFHCLFRTVVRFSRHRSKSPINNRGNWAHTFRQCRIHAARLSLGINPTASRQTRDGGLALPRGYSHLIRLAGGSAPKNFEQELRLVKEWTRSQRLYRCSD